MPDPLGDFSYTWPFYVAPILGYFLGSIPFGLLLTRLAGIGDIRRIGSGNIGATNVLRTGSKPLALLTVFLDGGKGALSYFLANLLGIRVFEFIQYGNKLYSRKFRRFYLFARITFSRMSKNINTSRVY